MLSKNISITARYLFIFFICVLFLSGCTGKYEAKTLQDYSLDTIVSVTYYSGEDEPAVREALKLCRDYETVFSRTDSESELYRLNECGSMEVSDDLLSVIKTGLYWCDISEGAFDITMGEVSGLYHFSDEPEVPEPAELEEALSHVGWKNIHIEGNTVTLEDPQAQIDLGAVAKGYIADRMKEFLTEKGVRHAVISLGGNVLCIGGKPDGEPFAVGIRLPEKDSSAVVTALNTSDLSVVTSGIYERFFEQDGVLYHHLLDPSSGQPVNSGLRAVSICAPCSADCDALSTVCFVLGESEGMKLIESLDNTEAIFIREDGELIRSSGFEAMERTK